MFPLWIPLLPSFVTSNVQRYRP